MRLPFVRTLAGSVAPTPPTTDPNFENVTLLLHGDGTNGGQNNTFVDGSANNFAITRNGNTTQGTFSPYGDRWSNYFDGTGDYLSIPDNAAFDFGTGDFTIECWAYISGNSSLDNGGSRVAGIFSGYTTTGTSTNSYTFEILGNSTTTGTGLGFYNNVSNVQTSVVATTTIAQHTWHHIAVARSGTTTRLFLNGAVIASGTLGNQNVNTDYTINIGRLGLAGYLQEFNGYISNLRVLKGTALYTGSYTVPTAPLTTIANTSLLTCQSNRFRDASANNFTITRNGDVSVQRFSPFHPTAAYSAGTIGGSGYFDGTGDYLTVPDNAAFDFGTGDFTIEAWVYIAGNSSLNGNSTRDATVFASFPTSSVGSLTNSWGFNITGSGTTTGVGLNFSNWQSGSNSVISATVTIPQTSWNHIAVARSGTTTKLFLNGAEVGSGTLSNQTVNSGYNLAVGRLGYPGYIQEVNGYISNVRVLKGTAQYTGTYTVPTSPLTAITNTSLLLNFQNAAILDNAMMAVPETVGNAQIDTTTKKFGTGSLEFDGTGDRLVIPANPNFLFGTGDWTVEAWVYIAGNSSANAAGNRDACIFSISSSSSSGMGLNVIGNATTTGTRLQLFKDTNTSVDINNVQSISQGVWHHIAACKASNTIRLFFNGTQVGSNVTDTTIWGSSTLPVNIGSLQRTGYINDLNGYIDDLRITKGVARYTANFTPPTAALPDL